MHPLIIGKLPEQNNIGGVVIFVSRLLASSDFLKTNKYKFYSTSHYHPVSLLLAIYKSSFVHFNGSEPFSIFFIALICKIFQKRLILSIHGEVGRHSFFLNILEILAIKLSYKPVVGIGSITKAIAANQDSVVVPSFIKPLIKKDPVVDQVFSLLSNNPRKMIYCTNANKIAFHKKQEIYGISHLIEYFLHQTDSILIVADTSGSYTKQFKDLVAKNIIFINRDVDFSYLIHRSDCFIRFTSTDGDSLSVMESIFLNTPVIATNCIRRPDPCILCEYGDLGSLDIAIKSIQKNGMTNMSQADIQSAEKYYDQLYRELSTVTASLLTK